MFLKRAALAMGVGDLPVRLSADHQFAQTDGQKPLGTDMFNWYASRLETRVHTDSALSEAFANVVTMREPPIVLLRPGIIRRVPQTLLA